MNEELPTGSVDGDGALDKGDKVRGRSTAVSAVGVLGALMLVLPGAGAASVPDASVGTALPEPVHAGVAERVADIRDRVQELMREQGGPPLGERGPQQLTQWGDFGNY